MTTRHSHRSRGELQACKVCYPLNRLTPKQVREINLHTYRAQQRPVTLLEPMSVDNKRAEADRACDKEMLRAARILALP